MPGSATRTGTAPSRAANTTVAVNASSVIAAVTPTNAAPSSPIASRRRGIGSARSARRAAPARRRTRAPASSPASRSRTRRRAGPAAWPPVGLERRERDRRERGGDAEHGAGEHRVRPRPGSRRRIIVSFIAIRTPTTTAPRRRRRRRRPARRTPPPASGPRAPRRAGPPRRPGPRAITATVSQSCSTSAITWLESSTEPPPATNRVRMRLTVAAETGSTASNGSSSTSSRGACSSAVASPIFFRIPEE